MTKLKLILSFIFIFIWFSGRIYCNGIDAEIIKNNVYYEVRGTKLYECDSVIIQINNQHGEDQANINVVKFNHGESLSGWIEDMSGKIIRRLKGSDITESNSLEQFTLEKDVFYKKFQLKYDVYPYRIVYIHSGSYDDFVACNWEPVEDWQIPILSAKLTFVYPLGYKIHLDVQNVPATHTDSLNSSIRKQWQISYKHIIHPENHSDFSLALPRIIIIPDKFTYGVEGSSIDWKSYGNWQYRLIKDLDDLPETEIHTAQRLVEGVSDTREKVRILYHYLQDHTRYINVFNGIGGFKPHPASYVVKYRYGDCKALSIYMKALLQAIQIPSYYTVVYLGEDPPAIHDSLPGPQYFNHIILTVPIGKDTIWLDNTNNIGPFGYVHSEIQGRSALLIDKLNSHLIRLPEMKVSENRICGKITIQINQDGNATESMNINYKGERFEQFNFKNEDLNISDKDNYIRKIIHFPNFELLDWDLKKGGRDSDNMSLNLKLTLYKFWNELGKDRFFYVHEFNIPEFSKVKERKLPVQILLPESHIDSILYEFPKSYSVNELPKDVVVNNKYGCYCFHAENKGDQVLIIKKFELYTGDYSLDQYPDFYSFMNSVYQFERTGIVLHRK